jgi:cell division protein FtsQ
MKGTPWENNIEKITVAEDGNLVIKPVQGKEQFIFGPPVRIAEKFSLMDRYYTTVAPSKEAGFYSTVDIRYKGQLVCRK